MQFDSENTSTHTITAYNTAGFTINDTHYAHSITIGADGHIGAWLADTQTIAASHVAELVLPQYDIILLGTGWQQHFPPAAWLAPFAAQQKPLEIMNTPAACRTYNILAAENRKVLAALYLPPNSNSTAVPFVE